MKEKENLPQLRQFIVTYFNESELRDLSFDLQIDYEGLPGPSKAHKARELVDHMWRHDRLDVLIETVSQLRPGSSQLVEEKTKKSDAFNDANDLRKHQMYLNRQDIFWIPFNKRVTQKFWVCGTSLVGVVERGLIQKYFEAQIRDIKVILPSTEEAFLSYEQLEKYDKLAENALVANQVKLAGASYQNLKAIISRYVPSPEKYLKNIPG